MKRSRALLTTMSAAVITLLLSACGAGSSANEPPTTPPTTTSSASDVKVLFPEAQPTGDFMTAEIRGKLVLDERGCLRVKHPADRGSVVPVWPAAFELDAEGEEVRVLDASGRIAAQVGKEVYMSGGAVGRSLEDKRQLQERCPGVYWIIGTEVRIPQEG